MQFAYTLIVSTDAYKLSFWFYKDSYNNKNEDAQDTSFAGIGSYTNGQFFLLAFSSIVEY